MTEGKFLSLVKKYDQRIPRYTSYPTAASLSSPAILGDILSALQNSKSHPVSLYVHLPFCASLCWFCACNRIVSRDARVVDPYIDALTREIELITQVGQTRFQLRQVHLGGGSPTFLSAPQLERLFALFSDGFTGFEDAQKSIELDPRTTTRDQIHVLRTAGFTRASLGVQDFDPSVQHLVHRVQPKEMVRSVMEMLREVGFTSINFDLIYGLPGQSRESIVQTVKEVVSMRPDRIALYGYAHVQWKAKAQKALERHPLPTAEERIRIFSCAEELLINSGYVPLGLDHFAVPDDELVAHLEAKKLRRTFMGYTTVHGEGVLGIGLSAISDIGDTLYQNEVTLKAYYNKIERGELPHAKSLVRTYDDKVRAYIIERIMCDGGVTVDQAPEDLKEDVFEILGESMKELELLRNDGLITLTPESVQATFDGRLFLRSIAAKFDRYLGRNELTFSRAV
jgi:oxygen-independent coproporphyrinogen III oxidase